MAHGDRADRWHRASDSPLCGRWSCFEPISRHIVSCLTIRALRDHLHRPRDPGTLCDLLVPGLAAAVACPPSCRTPPKGRLAYRSW